MGRAHNPLSVLEDINCQNDIVTMLLDGRSHQEIMTFLSNKYSLGKAKGPRTADSRITEAREIIRQRKNFEVNNLIAIHAARYERIYRELMELKLLSLAQMTLQAKEKLLGFHREDFHMKVSNGTMTEITLKNVKNEFDVKKLNSEKHDRLAYLLQKAKRTSSK